MRIILLLILILNIAFNISFAEQKKIPDFPAKGDTSLEKNNYGKALIKDGKNEDITLEADKVEKTPDGQLKATGNVTLLKDKFFIKADNALYDPKTNELTADGNLFIYTNDTYLWGESCSFSTDDATGEFNNVKGFMQPFSYFQADKLTKESDSVYLLEDMKFSTCTGEKPAWSLTATDAKIELGRYFTSYNTAFKAGPVPLLFTPYMAYPIKTERETGLLVPPFGFSSARGAFVAPKFFLNIDVDKDLTIASNIFSEGGFLHQAEYRQKISRLSDIYIYGEYIDDPGTESDRENRYLFYTDTTLSFNENARLVLKSDYAGDYRYLNDFEDFMMTEMGEYSNSDNMFYHNARLEFDYEYADFRLKIMEDTDYEEERNGYFKSTITRAPSFSISKDLYRPAPVNFKYTVQYDKVRIREKTVDFDGANTIDTDTYNRTYFEFGLYKPVNLGVGTATPYYTRSRTEWSNLSDTSAITENRNDGSKLTFDSDSAVRDIYAAGIVFELNEIFRNYEGFRHSIYNTFKAEYIPNIDQAGLPDYIENDLIEGHNLYSYTLENNFNAKDWGIDVEITAGYDAMSTDREWQDYETNVDIHYKEFFKASARHLLDHYTGGTDFVSKKAEFNFKPVTLEMSYTFDREIEDDENTELTTKIKLDLDKYRFEIAAKNTGRKDNPVVNNLGNREYSALAVYKADCWELGLKYSRKDYYYVDGAGEDSGPEHSIMILFTLRGLGGMSL